MSLRDEASLQLRVPICSAIFFSDESVHEREGKNQRGSFRPDILCCQCSARKPTAKDLKDVEEHENDPVEPKDHDTMDDTVEDL
jgi:hypothetical protein